jgi:alkylhydroperoxidase family enzyme
MTTARVLPLAPPYSDAVAAALDRVMPAGVPPLLLFRALAVNERVFLRLMAGGLLDRGSLTLREREIVIDRTCARCGAEYEWGVHVAFFAGKAKLTPEEIAGMCATDPAAAPFSPRERLLLRLVDELHDIAHVSDELWRRLAGAWSSEQIVELIALAGFYHMISFLANGLRIPPESYGAQFPAPEASTAARRRGNDHSSPFAR